MRLLIIFILLTGCLDTAPKTTFATRDIYVVDGDTIKIGERTFRLMGYDTPETYRAKCDSERAWGNRATKRLIALIKAETTTSLAIESRKDKYGRELARLYVGGDDVGLILIRERLARVYSGGKRAGWCG